MLRALLCFGAVAVLALPGRAGETVSGSETLIRLSVTPAAAPIPALRYRLLPELKELNPGNPVQGYMRAFLAHQKFFFDEDSFDRREKLLVMPLEGVPTEEDRDYGPLMLALADQAARLDNPDWQVLRRLKTEGFSLLLPEVQQVRSLTRALKARFQSEVASGRFDDAVRTAKTMFAMARHLEEHPTIIGGLVGTAIASLTIGTLEEMLEKPGCPNLYWALTTLPGAFISLDHAMDGERMLIETELSSLDDGAPMSMIQIQKFAEHWDKLLGPGGASDARKGVRVWLDARNKDEALLGAARRRLIEGGLPEERLRQFSADQVILLDEKRECFVRFDDFAKTIALPFWRQESRSVLHKLDKEPGRLFANDLVPGMSSARRAHTRLGQRIAMLRHVEALRLHAAEHDGALPENLNEVSVPLPDDPFTGKPFRYEVQGNTAHLRGSTPPGEEKNFAFNIHYEVTLQD